MAAPKCLEKKRIQGHGNKEKTGGKETPVITENAGSLKSFNKGADAPKVFVLNFEFRSFEFVSNFDIHEKLWGQV
jgi:hypothetical protein